MMWLSIYLPLLPLEVFDHSAEDSEKPLAITDGQRILLCNQPAKIRGIEAGLTVHTALSLYSDLSLKERSFDKEQKTLGYLAEIAYQFSSQLVLYTNRQQQHSLLLEIAGSLRLFNNLDQLLSAVQQAFSQTTVRGQGFSRQLAIADTPKAAELLARWGLKRSEPINSFSLEHTPITLLDCSPRIIQQCQDMGLEKVGQLLALPAPALEKRFDPAFIQYLHRLRGSEPDPQNYFQPPDFFQRELFYINGLRRHDDLQHPISKLLAELCHYLQRRQLQCIALHWQFTRFSKQKNRLDLQFSQAQSQYHILLSLTQLQLVQLPLDSPVESVELYAGQFCPVDFRHQDLFNSHNQRGNPPLLADKITGKLGQQALQIVQRFDRHLPEQKSRLQKPEAFFTQAQNRHSPENSKTRSASPSHKKIDIKDAGPSHLLPAWLLPKPRPIEQRNYTLYLKHHALEIIRGPERIEVNWWKKKASRDYFIAATRDRANKSKIQGFYWIYFDRLEKNWYLHGLFV